MPAANSKAPRGSAVRKLLSEIKPGLYALAPGLLHRATDELDALTGAINATRVHGGWVSIQKLPTRQRRQVDVDVDATLENPRTHPRPAHKHRPQCTRVLTRRV